MGIVGTNNKVAHGLGIHLRHLGPRVCGGIWDNTKVTAGLPQLTLGFSIGMHAFVNQLEREGRTTVQASSIITISRVLTTVTDVMILRFRVCQLDNSPFAHTQCYFANISLLLM